MYGEMNNGWRDGGAERNCNPCLTKLKICPYPYPWSLSQVTLQNSQNMAEQFFFSIKNWFGELDLLVSLPWTRDQILSLLQLWNWQV